VVGEDAVEKGNVGEKEETPVAKETISARPLHKEILNRILQMEERIGM
jgi:hypothetical protein